MPLNLQRTGLYSEESSHSSFIAHAGKSELWLTSPSTVQYMAHLTIIFKKIVGYQNHMQAESISESSIKC